jgi:hypothetical protein
LHVWLTMRHGHIKNGLGKHFHHENTVVLPCLSKS